MTLRSVLATLAAVLLVPWIGATPAGARAKVESKASAGCGSSKVREGEERISTTSGGVERGYFRHVPPAHDGEKPLPLVLDLHGASEPSTVHKGNSSLGTLGDERGFVTITPDGSGPVPHWDTRLESTDMVFLVDVLDEVEQTLCIDESRVFVAGYSNGAFAASVLACAYSDRIAAVAPVAGIRNVPGCAPARPVPVVAFHGTADEFVRFEGGLGSGVADLPPAEAQALIDLAAPTDSGESIPEVAAAWAQRNGCAAAPKERSVASDVTLVRYRCPGRADVQLYVAEGAGHTWPGSQFSKAIEQFVGPTTFSIDASTIMWRFFERHPLRDG